MTANKDIWQSIRDKAIAYGRKLELSCKEQDTSLAPLKKPRVRKRKQKNLNLESDKDSQKPD